MAGIFNLFVDAFVQQYFRQTIISFSLTDITIWEAAGIAVVGTLIASGIYPAMLFSSFKPIQSLKGKITSGVGIATLRKALVVFQFSISVVLLVCTIL